MKKILAVILSLAMILSMTVVGFAAEAPAADADATAWTAYYTEVLTDETLDADAKADLMFENMPIDPAVMVQALTASMNAAREAGVDMDAITVALMQKVEEETGINAEDMLGEDIDGDGFIGDPANGNLAKPEATDVEGWTEYYAALLGKATTDPAAMGEVVAEIADTVINNDVDMETFKTAFPEAAKIVGGDLVNQVVWGVESLLSMDLNADNYIGKPTAGEDNGELPEDPNEGGATGGFDINDLLNTVLGFLGTIGDLIFGGGGDTPPVEEEPTDPWGDDNTGNDDGSTIPDTGDTTVFAVAAVALAAGAALVMTRKKSEDAE